MYFAGYRLQNGDMCTLNFLQKKVAGIMFNEKLKYVKANKGFVVMGV